MQISILLAKQIAELFLMILMGYIVVKLGLVTDDDSKVLSKIVLYLVIPCVIIDAFQIDYTPDKVQGMLLALAASVILQVLLLIAVWVMGKIFRLDEVEVASIYYSNSGNLIVPIVTYVLGKEWVVYGCVFMSVQLIFMWTHGKHIISSGEKFDWKKIVLNINMIAIFLGALLFLLKIQLPGVIDDTLSAVGGTIGPVSMIVTGMLIAGMNLRDIFTNKRVYVVTFLRLILVPLVALVILKMSGLIAWHPQGEKILLVIFLAVITPSASTVTQMCQVYGGNSKYSSAINVMTTLLAIVTMPVMVLVYQNLLY